MPFFFSFFSCYFAVVFRASFSPFFLFLFFSICSRRVRHKKKGAKKEKKKKLATYIHARIARIARYKIQNAQVITQRTRKARTKGMRRRCAAPRNTPANSGLTGEARQSEGSFLPHIPKRETAIFICMPLSARIARLGLTRHCDYCECVGVTRGAEPSGVTFRQISAASRRSVLNSVSAFFFFFFCSFCFFLLGEKVAFFATSECG